MRRFRIAEWIIVALLIVLCCLTFSGIPLQIEAAKSRYVEQQVSIFNDSVQSVQLFVTAAVHDLELTAAWVSTMEDPTETLTRARWATIGPKTVGRIYIPASGFRAISWIERLQYDELQGFANLTRLEYVSLSDDVCHYVHDGQGSDVSLQPIRPYYYPVRVIWPEQGNIAALCYDGASEAIRNAALLEMETSMNSTASAAVRLVQGGLGIILFTPVVSATNASLVTGAISAALSPDDFPLADLGTKGVGVLYELETDMVLWTNLNQQNDTDGGIPVNITSFIARYADCGATCFEPIVVGYSSKWVLCIAVAPGYSPWITFNTVGLLPLISLSVFTTLIVLTVSSINSRIGRARIQAQKDDFLANMSHELRTPLTSVVLASQLLESQTLDPETRKKLCSTIHLSSALLLGLINDLLDLSRLQAGQELVIKSEPVDLEDTINEAAKVVRLLAEQSSITINVFVLTNKGSHHQLPMAQGDALRLSQVFINLLSNAIKFSQPNQEVNVSVGLVDDDGPGGGGKPMLRVDVRDFGRGISPEDQARLFRRFQQTQKKGKNVPTPSRRDGHFERGTGLGLVICASLLKMMHGSIRVFSDGLGCGTTMSVLVPVSDQQKMGLHTSNESTASTLVSRESFSRDDSDATTGGGGDVRMDEIVVDVNSGKKNVLLVDDTVVNLMLLKRMFESFGANVVTATSGELALDRCEDSGPFDVVFMDVYMPGMGGLQATSEIRRKGLVPADCPIMVLTASMSDRVEKEAKEAGADRILIKPISKDILLEVLFF